MKPTAPFRNEISMFATTRYCALSLRALTARGIESNIVE